VNKTFPIEILLAITPSNTEMLYNQRKLFLIMVILNITFYELQKQKMGSSYSTVIIGVEFSSSFKTLKVKFCNLCVKIEFNVKSLHTIM